MGDVRPAIAIHAGAGRLTEDLPAHEVQCRACLENILADARSMLESGNDAVAVAVTAVATMEAFPLFNAGYGATLCADGTVELSAAVMRGLDRAVGAAAGLRSVKHPIHAALALLDSEQVMMIGDHAERAVLERGCERMANEHLVTDRQRKRLQAKGSADRGTVGAVCLDRDGNLAAATSTGGRLGQPRGRVGDSPIIGAGTWSDQNVAVSCTGEGESFIRAGAARHLATLVGTGERLDDAAAAALDEVKSLGGTGGLIAVDARGSLVVPFTTEVMPRGTWSAGREPRTYVIESDGHRSP
jgi:L-asparaginase / beta-aspartyl-peptidase